MHESPPITRLNDLEQTLVGAALLDIEYPDGATLYGQNFIAMRHFLVAGAILTHITFLEVGQERDITDPDLLKLQDYRNRINQLLCPFDKKRVLSEIAGLGTKPEIEA